MGQYKGCFQGSLRLPEYDYSQNGAYFVTLVTYQRQHLFGKVIQEEMKLSKIGGIVYTTWLEVPLHFCDVKIDIFVIMPNHIHGIIFIDHVLPPYVAATHASQLHRDQFMESMKKPRPRGPAPGSLSAIIGSFKSAVSKRIHHVSGFETIKVWQRNYYEHIIRDERALHRIVEYIEANPYHWVDDPVNLPFGYKDQAIRSFSQW